MAAVNPTEVSYQIPIAGNNPDYSYVYTYTGTGHGGGDTNLYFYLPPGELPAPTGLKATAVSSSQINLTWVDSGTTEQGFKIERCTGAGCSNFAQIATVGREHDRLFERRLHRFHQLQLPRASLQRNR